MRTKLILLAFSAACFISSCGGGSSKKTSDSADANKKVDEPTVQKESIPIPENLSEEPVIEIQTSMGNIKVKLYKDTPLHRDNFVRLVSEGYYNGILFHRVIKDFMIQAGDPESINAPADKKLGNGGPDYTIPAEILRTHYHKKGALAAARKSDSVNPERASSGSHFYIVQGKPITDEELSHYEKERNMKYTDEEKIFYKTTGGVPRLDTEYTVFGEVIEGLNIVDAIAAVSTAVGEGDRPHTDVKIIKMVFVE